MRPLFCFFLRRTPPEHRRKYLRVHSESSFNDDPVFCSMVRDSIGSHSEFLPKALSSEFIEKDTFLEQTVLHLCLGISDKASKDFSLRKTQIFLKISE